MKQIMWNKIINKLSNKKMIKNKIRTNNQIRNSNN